MSLGRSWRQFLHHDNYEAHTKRIRKPSSAVPHGMDCYQPPCGNGGGGELKDRRSLSRRSCAQSVPILGITRQNQATLPRLTCGNKPKEQAFPTLNATKQHRQGRTLNPLVRVRIPAWHPSIRDIPLVPEPPVLPDWPLRSPIAQSVERATVNR